MTARLIFDRILVYGVALILALWVLAPLYLITIAAFSPQATAYDFPKQLLPTTLSAETMQFFLNSRGVVPSIINSLVVALLTILIALTLGTPAGYALARFRFRGRDAFSVLVLTTRMFPVAILSIPLAVAFLRIGLYSWNEVFAATILTLRERTFPAQVLTALDQSLITFKFAGGFVMAAPAIVFIFFMRRYLLNLWGGR
ncbi:MAG: carbohydrate ABC transporter permease [Chloroflexi bacterium]|nr:MAG: carbohydrate ABC transporter permease [Chloroflexota bacterium]